MNNELTKKQNELLEELIQNAGIQYWQQDRGVGKAVDKAAKDFQKTKSQMVNHLKRQNATIRRLRKNLKELT